MYSKNSTIVMCLDSFAKQIYNIWVFFSHYFSLRDDCLVHFANEQYCPLVSFARYCRVTHEAFIAEP